jgi:nitrate reductase beta subunit
MCLIPWTLRSGSEQFIYNWKLEKQPGPGLRKLEEAQRNVREENRNKD